MSIREKANNTIKILEGDPTENNDQRLGKNDDNTKALCLNWQPKADNFLIKAPQKRVREKAHSISHKYD